MYLAGKGSTKADRLTCKDCGASEWIVATDETEMLKASMISEAKMMGNMEGAEQKGDVVVHGKLPEALVSLHGMMQLAAAAAAAKGNRAWEFRGVHLGLGPAAGKLVSDCVPVCLNMCEHEYLLLAPAVYVLMCGETLSFPHQCPRIRM